MDIWVEVSRMIDAPADTIYEVLVDYQRGHAVILPRQYFKELVVEEGGRGAGTVARVRMSVLGMGFGFRLRVDEPSPGRVLTETDLETNLTTSFTLEPAADGRRSKVTIATVFKPSPGVRGFFERLTTPPVMRRIYRAELQQLAEYLSS